MLLANGSTFLAAGREKPQEMAHSSSAIVTAFPRGDRGVEVGVGGGEEEEKGGGAENSATQHVQFREF